MGRSSLASFGFSRRRLCLVGRLSLAAFRAFPRPPKDLIRVPDPSNQCDGSRDEACIQLTGNTDHASLRPDCWPALRPERICGHK